jgi:hypothetical protein
MLYNRVFAVIDKRNGLLVDAWVADTIEEAQLDNPDKKIIDLINYENMSFAFDEIWKVQK